MQKATKVLKTTLEHLYEQLHQDLFSSYTCSSSELWLDTTPVDHDSKAWKKKVSYRAVIDAIMYSNCNRSGLINSFFYVLWLGLVAVLLVASTKLLCSELG